MDLRKYFAKRPRLQIEEEASIPAPLPVSLPPARPISNQSKTDTVEKEGKAATFDIGTYVGKSVPNNDKLKIISSVFVPDNRYNFKDELYYNRPFRLEWLVEFAPWLAYSKVKKGPLCIYCVLFPPQVHRGYVGKFIAAPCKAYNNLPKLARHHVTIDWHKNAEAEYLALLKKSKYPENEIICLLDKNRRKQIEENRKKLGSIVASILFCGMHDLALRGKDSKSGNMQHLFNFRIDSGDTILKDHLENAPKNAKYTSVQTEHEIVEICETVIRDQIVSEANKSVGFAILADETADIAGIEQLSIGVRFLDENCKIREEFLGFAALHDMTAEGVSRAILSKCDEFGLHMHKLVGQGYDGCPTMAGIDGGVQAIIKKLYPNAIYVHCAAHRLNLAVNDLNKVREIQNTIGAIKEIISFFRDSSKRRATIPSIQTLCDTRWTAKYKSISHFARYFEEIYKQLEVMSVTRDKTGASAHSLLTKCSTPAFIICLRIIAHYSEILEPITQILQSKDLDLMSVHDHIQELISIFQIHRKKSEIEFKNHFKEAQNMADKLDIVIKIPRRCTLQTNRDNYEGENPEDYFRISIFNRYLDSLCSFLKTRFSGESKIAFSLFQFFPKNISKISKEDFMVTVEAIQKLYNIPGLEANASIWHDKWTHIESESVPENLVDILESCKYNPSVSSIIKLAKTIPVTTCTIERSFSTLRRVKTWLRSTMSETRLSGLCMISVHKQMLIGEKEQKDFIAKVIDKFANDSRRLQLLFQE